MNNITKRIWERGKLYLSFPCKQETIEREIRFPIKSGITMKMKKNIFIISIITLTLININLSAVEMKAGRIFGAITDKDTKAPIAGVNVLIPILEKGISSDAKGHFILKDIPVGSYTVHFQFIGYKPVSKTDVIVKSNRSTALNAELKISPIVIEGITVKNEEYFSETEEQPASVINFSYEEIRRAPGSGGDVSRIMMGLPCVAKVNDQSNNLVVRGGSPVENAFFIDNIEIPNINHFPTQGSSGGPILHPFMAISRENWKERVYDNRYIFSVEGGYKPNYKWEYSLRWIYAGGVPYTSFDTEASQQMNIGILDENRINNERYQDYHSLNIRFDRRFHFNRTNLVLYISVWNVYNQKNVATYYWNQFRNEEDTILQWGILPIFGVEYEF